MLIQATRRRDLGTRGDGRYRVVDEEVIVAAYVRSLWPYEAQGDPAAAAGEARRLLDRWIAAGLPARSEGGRRKLDPCEAYNFAMQAWIDDGDPAWLSHQVASSRRLVTDLRAHAATGQRLAVSLRREFNLASIAAGTALRLRAPLPLDAADGTTRIDRHPDAPPAAEFRSGAGRLEARFTMPAPPIEAASIGATSLLAPDMPGTPITEDLPASTWDTTSRDYTLYTRAHEGLIRITPAVTALADALHRPGDSPARYLVRVWEHFVRRMRFGFIHYDELDPDDPLGTILRTEWSDCHVGASLFAALARCRGIPARVVSGLCLYPLVPAQHSWLEVLLPPHGWLPIDLAGVFMAARSLTDPEWSRCFLGTLEPRMTCERLPDQFVGAVGLRIPASWFVLHRLTDAGATLTLGCLDERRWIYRDHCAVRSPPAATSAGSTSP